MAPPEPRKGAETEGRDGGAEAPEGADPREETPREEAAEPIVPAERTVTPEEESYLEQLQRLHAEFSNYRRRVLREKAEWDTRSKAELLTALLPILDDLDRAEEARRVHAHGEDAEGLLLILSRLAESLRALGLEMQPTPRGTPFDPLHHEALLTEPDDEFPEGTILETLQPGYLYRGILLRPARVRVSRSTTS
jgi:molecular chaperone GrpE